MREFRRYLVDTAGWRLVQLWMDIERFHRIDSDDERSRWLHYREIQIAFYDFYEAPPPAAKNPHAKDYDVSCVLVGMYSIVVSVSQSVSRRPYSLPLSFFATEPLITYHAEWPHVGTI